MQMCFFLHVSHQRDTPTLMAVEKILYNEDIVWMQQFDVELCEHRAHAEFQIVDCKLCIQSQVDLMNVCFLHALLTYLAI